jgi:hypothetical protein
MQLRVEMSWETVGQVTVEDGLMLTPPMPEAPGVYQWVFHHDDHDRHYVGEADNLDRRFLHYRMPGSSPSTNLRMNESAIRVIGAGGSVDILLARNIVFSGDDIDGVADLTSPFARRFIKNAALIALVAANCSVVNGEGHGEHRADNVLE